MTLSIRLLATIAAGVLAAAGCLSGDTGTAVSDTSPTTTSPATTAMPTTRADAASGDAVKRQVDKSGWYGGFRITVDEVAATPGTAATKVDVTLSYENLVGVKQSPPDTGYLEIDEGEVVKVSFDNPEIAGFGKGTGTATASLGSADTAATADETLDSLALVYGEGDANLTKIPFASDAKVESIEPRGITVGQTIGSPVKVQLTKAFLWPSYQEGEKGQYELWVEFKADCPDCPAGAISMDRSSFTLTSPNGQTVQADARSDFVSGAVASTQNVEGKWLVFLIDAPAQGEYTFKIKFVETGIPVLTEEDSTKIIL